MSVIATKRRVFCVLSSVLWLGLSGTLIAQEAAAQTVTYTARQLKAPSGIRRTCPYDFFLSETGALASLCYFKNGYSRADLGNGVSFPVQNEIGRVVTWPAGTSTATVLKTPTALGTTTMVVYGIDKQGHILAGGLYGGLYWYNAGIATPFKPVGSSGGYGEVRGFSPSGTVLLSASDANATLHQLILAQGTQTMTIPWAIPAPSPYYETAHGLNDAGQIAVCMSDDIAQIALRFWDGQQWLDMAATDPAGHGNCLKPVMAENGAVYMPDNQPAGMHVWRHPADPQQAPEFVPEASGVSPDGGTLFGTATFPNASKFGAFGKQRAAIWVNGKAVDVNTLVTPPFLQKFMSVTQMNQHGQFTVNAVSTLGTSTTWLISPKK